MYKNYKIIATTFAGRQDRMSLLVEYMKKAIQGGLVDEWHIWDFCRKDADRQWIKTLPEQCSGFKIFLRNENVSNDMRLASWKPYYSHYNLKNFDENTLIVKIDDDIVYVDLENLSKFIDYRIADQDSFIVSANVINNGVCAGLQTIHGILPKDLYPPNGIPFQSLCGVLWENGLLAEKVHEYFINNMEKFKKLNFVYRQPIGERISINCISILGKDFKYTENIDVDDEGNIGTNIPLQLRRHNTVFMPFTVSHLSFFKQEETGMDVEKIIKLYRDII